MREVDIAKAVKILRGGGVIVFPTDTVWGVGAWVGSKAGIEKLYTIKKRDLKKPTAILIGKMDQALNYGEFSNEALSLAERFWPGALTIIVKASAETPKEIQNEAGGVGIRWPKSALIEALCAELPGGIVASSANEAGEPAPVELGKIAKTFLAKCDFLIEGERPLSGTASTVVEMMQGSGKVIRQGEIEIFRESGTK